MHVPWLRSLLPKLVWLVAALGALLGVWAVHVSGQSLLAAVLLVLAALALWIYGSARTQASRYLFPAIAAALVFVVFPMLYTVATGFTNHSSRNLLDLEGARAFLLDDHVEAEGPTCGFTLHGDGAAAAGLRLLLRCPGGGAVGNPGDTTWLSPLLSALGNSAAPAAVAVALQPVDAAAAPTGQPLPLPQLITHLPQLRALPLQLPNGPVLRLKSLREFAPLRPVYVAGADGSLTNKINGQVLRPNLASGFFEAADGQQIAPGFSVHVGWQNYQRIFTDPKFSQPFLRVFVWTLIFAALTVAFTASLGLFLAVLLSWPPLQFKGAYRLVLFLPYAVPGFISILVFKGLFNQNLGEINFILHGLFGLRPAWFSDPLLAKLMLLAVNTWLGFPYMMVLCSGLLKAIPADLYEASAVQGAGPLANFWRITLPLVGQPLLPLLIAAFAFNFNNFALISLLTEGRPDFLDASVPAGTTDILVSYTWRIAFQDSGQQFGLAAALSTVIFVLVAAVTLQQLRFARRVDVGGRQ